MSRFGGFPFLLLFLDVVFWGSQDRAEISELEAYGKDENYHCFGFQALADCPSWVTLGISIVSAFWLFQVLGLVSRLRIECATVCGQRPDPRADLDQ